MDPEAAGRGALVTLVRLDHLHEVGALKLPLREFERNLLLHHLHDEFMQLAAHQGSTPIKMRIEGII